MLYRWTGVMCIVVIVISCLGSHSDGTHSLQRSKRCNAKFLQICSDEETNSSNSWMDRMDFWVNYSSKPLQLASTAVKLGFKEGIKDINLLVQKAKKNVLEASERQAGLTVGTGREPWRFREELDAERLRAVSVSPGPGPDAHCCSWHDREEEEEEEGDAECEEAWEGREEQRKEKKKRPEIHAQCGLSSRCELNGEIDLCQSRRHIKCDVN